VNNPFKFRPGDPGSDPDHDGEITDWEDNPTSNALAWASSTFLPTWCQNETHWTARTAAYFWTSCPCCAFFRGVFIGAALIMNGILWVLMLIALYAAFVR
jgi:hypothetical protein